MFKLFNEVQNCTNEGFRNEFSTPKNLQDGRNSNYPKTFRVKRQFNWTIMHIHRHIPFDVEKVITRFAKPGSRKRLDFII